MILHKNSFYPLLFEQEPLLYFIKYLSQIAQNRAFKGLYNKKKANHELFWKNNLILGKYLRLFCRKLKLSYIFAV